MPFSRTIAAITLALLTSVQALAELPTVLDRVPLEGPQGVIALPSLQRFDDNSSELLLSLEANAVSSFSQLLGALGLRDGLDMNGSAAGVVYPSLEDDPDAGPRLVVLLPVEDDVALGRSLSMVEIEGSDVAQFQFGENTYYARTLASPFAAFGTDRFLLESFPDESGFAAGHAEQVGPRALRAAESADIIAVTEAGDARPLLAGLLGPLLEAAPGLPIPGALGAGDPRAGVVRSLLERLERDGTAATLAISTGPLGVKLDLITHLKPESELGALAKATPDPKRGLDDLPNMGAIFSGSMNLTHPGWRTLLVESAAPLHEAGEAPDRMTARLARSIVESIEDLESASVAVYAPAAVFNGLLSRTAISWQGEAGAPGVARSFQKWITDLADSEVFLSTYESGANTVKGTPIDEWSIVPNTAAAQPSALFGTSGTIRGSLFVTGDRGGMIWGTDEALINASVKIEDPLGRAVMLDQVSQLLPEDRVVEWYLDLAPALALYGPMLAMLTGGQPIEIPEILPPIGSSMSMSDGAIHGAMFIPASLIKLSIDTIQRVAATQGLGPQGRPQQP